LPYRDPAKQKEYYRIYNHEDWLRIKADPDRLAEHIRRQREWYRRNPEKVKLHSRQGYGYKVNRQLELVRSLGGRCQRCGYSKCLSALTFHHLVRGSWKKRNRDWLRPDFDTTKVMLLCRNCHAEIEHKYHREGELAQGMLLIQ